MRGRVVEVNFLNSQHWLFKIEDETSNKYFIMDLDFYRTNSLQSPVTKRELDSLDKGMSLNFEFILIGDDNIITKLV